MPLSPQVAQVPCSSSIGSLMCTRQHTPPPCGLTQRGSVRWFSDCTSSVHGSSTRALLRVPSTMAASKPTFEFSLDPYDLLHFATICHLTVVSGLLPSCPRTFAHVDRLVLSSRVCHSEFGCRWCTVTCPTTTSCSTCTPGPTTVMLKHLSLRTSYRDT